MCSRSAAAAADAGVVVAVAAAVRVRRSGGDGGGRRGNCGATAQNYQLTVCSSAGRTSFRQVCRQHHLFRLRLFALNLRQNATHRRCFVWRMPFEKASPAAIVGTHHFVVDFVKVNFAHFVHHVFALKCDESKTYVNETCLNI